MTQPPAPEPHPTGDPVVDQAMEDFELTQDDLAAQVAAASVAHRRLQHRLTDPGAVGSGERPPGP
ncbi:MAG: hypothetical protein M3424_04540 [Actinomycetota bacterium]|nr:hypothetical protein [Actinomycetota bacterium]